MEQLDKEVIDKLSEPAKRVFRSLDYRSQRRMLKKAKAVSYTHLDVYKRQSECGL